MRFAYTISKNKKASAIHANASSVSFICARLAGGSNNICPINKTELTSADLK
jgi:hypothetical protein